MQVGENAPGHVKKLIAEIGSHPGSYVEIFKRRPVFQAAQNDFMVVQNSGSSKPYAQS